MKKKLYLVIRNMLIFWVFVTAMPGLSSPKGPIGLLIGGLGFGFIMAYLSKVLKFFKFPVNFWGKLIVGSLMTILWMVLMNFVVKGVIDFGPGYIGGSDFILFTIPKLIRLPNALVIILVSSVLLVVCSIIVGNLAKQSK
ncbi:MAG: hypothetical protein ACE5DX_04380 [Candidatus Dojkabacteria bacterium]